MAQDPLELQKPDLSAGSFEKQVKQLTEAARTRRLIWTLTMTAALPFVVFAGAFFALGTDHPLAPILIDGLKTYCAIVLSFMGGVRWGLAMKDAPELGRKIFILSIVPPLVAWASLFLPLPYVFGVQALVVAAQGAWDSFAGEKGVFGLWFVKLRIVFTFIAVASLVAGFFATV